MKKIFAVIIILALGAGITHAADIADDMIVYRGGGDNSIPEYRLHDSGGFGSEGTAQDVTSPIEWIKVISKPGIASVEKIMCTGDNADDVNCQVWNGTNWGNLIEISTAKGANRGFDLAYEGISGRGIVCSRTAADTQTPVCRIWNGTSWSSEFAAASTGAALLTIRLIPDPNSNYIALISRNNANDIMA